MIREDFQRIRSEREKAARRTEILSTARELLLESRNEKLSISALANKIGVSSSTIFLYFNNREELLAALYVRAVRAYFDDVMQTLQPGISDQEYAEVLIDKALANPAMMIMRRMILRTIEDSLSQAFVLPAVQEIQSIRITIGTRTDEVLGLEPGQGRRLLKALINLMAGAGQANIWQYVDKEGLPEDVVETMRAAEIRAAFLSGAELVMKGIRA